MKRWNNKLLEQLPDDLLLSNFQRVVFGKQVLYLFLLRNPYPVHDVGLILDRLDYINLPYMDVYSVNLGDAKGLSLGYAFDIYGRVIKNSLNYLLSSNHEFSRLDVASLNTAAFDMQYKLDSMLLYSYAGACSLATVTFPDSIKACLDIN